MIFKERNSSVGLKSGVSGLAQVYQVIAFEFALILLQGTIYTLDDWYE